MLKKNSILVSLILLSLFAISQTDSKIPFNLNYLPPSPNATSIAKFGDIPVGLNTGIPKITVPIYSYEMGDENLSLSVSLDFHAGGFRVEEISGNIGLGWALNAGGVVTRSMRGLPDDLETNGFLARGHNQTPVGNEALYAKNRYDSEQDVFHYNANGLSGKFILGADGKGVLINSENTKVEIIYNNTPSRLPILGFCIKDDKGIRYYFTEKEDTQTRLGEDYPVSSFTSAWYLSVIENPFTNSKIKFNYESSIVYNEFNNAETRMNEYTSNYGIKTNHDLNLSSVSKNNFQVLSKRISEIVNPNGVTIKFVYSTIGRCDLMGDKALKKIEILDATNNTSKKYSLFQSYVGSGAKTSYEPAPCNTSGFTSLKYLRLRLDSLKEESNYSNPYIFEYNDETYLPSTDSKSQDMFGYFNASSNNTLVPRLAVVLDKYYMLDGANRRVNPSSVKASSIKKVTYPTNGYTQFEFEVNSAGDERLHETIVTRKTIVPPASFYSTGSSTFTINRLDADQIWKVDLRMLAWCPGLNTGCSLRVVIKSLDGLVTLGTATFDYSSLGISKRIEVSNFPNGSYLLSWFLIGGNGCQCNDLFDLSLSWEQVEKDLSQFAGGLRLKRQIDHDGLSSNNNIISDYQYLLEDGRSSGTVSNIQNYKANYNIVYCQTNQGNFGPISSSVEKTFFVRTSTSNHPLNYFSGSSVAYTRVKVKKNGGGLNNGEEVFFYSGYDKPLQEVIPDITEANIAPFIPLQIYDWKLGNLLKHEIFNASGSIVKRTINQYRYYYNIIDDVKNFKVGIGLYVSDFVCSRMNQSFFNKYYYWSTGRKELMETRETSFTPRGDSIFNVTEFNYHPVFFYPKSKKTSNSIGGSTEQNFYYTYDYSLSIYKRLVDSNLLVKPISIERWLIKNNSKFLVDAGVSEYQFENGLFTVKKYYKLNSSSPIAQANLGGFNASSLLRSSEIKEEVFFEKYNARQNVTQLKLKNIVKSYIWNSSGQYPLTEVINALVKDIFHTSFEDSEGNSNEAKTGRKGRTGIYNKALSNLSDGAYILSYWQKSGSVWTYVENKVSVIGTTFNISIGSSTTQVDEVRFYPYTAQMTTYTYEPLVGMTSQCDVNNRITYYEYDGFQRLVLIRDQDKNIIKKICYNYAGQPEDCVPNVSPNWQATGTTRCQPCATNTSYTNNIRERQERDNNTSSPTYNQLRWVSEGVNAACTITPGWTNTATAIRCKKNASNVNTGEQEQEQKDMNPCSPTYNQLRWVVTGTNTTACPLACNTSNCTGTNRKCVNGSCETAIRFNTNSYSSGSKYVCVYHYQWSDGSRTQDFTETNNMPCAF